MWGNEPLLIKEKVVTFEQKLEKLNDIVEKLETGEALTLDESLTYFEDGITLVRDCRQLLEAAELRVQNAMEDDTPESGEDNTSLP